MKYLIYNNELEAQIRADKCFDDMQNKEGTTSYCDVIKHTADDLWAVVVDSRVEYLFTPQELIDSQNLDYTWFTIIPDTNPTGYKRITTKSTNIIKIGAGILRSIVVGNAGSGGNVITIYDNISAVAPVIQMFLNAQANEYQLNTSFNTGLTVKSSTGTAADFTVYYE
jgi:hypothetical protein